MKPVYTIEDLASREGLDAGATWPARLAVIGWPVAHSASPQMHQAALDEAGIALRYIRLAIEPGAIREALFRLRDLGFVGCNVTVPHKLDAMAACDEVDENAVVLGAVNTLCFEGGRIKGYNTDGPGFARAIEWDFGVRLSGLDVMILGAGGGAGQALAAQCVLMGVRRLVLVNRTVEKLAPLVERLSGLGRASVIEACALGSAEVSEQSRLCNLLVNTSSMGLKESDPLLIGREDLVHQPFVYDTIYQPEVTGLLRLAGEMGCRTANGRSMLWNQGALAFQQWFPESDPWAAMREVMSEKSFFR